MQSLSLAIRHIDGGRDRFVELVQQAQLNGYGDAEKFLIVYADLKPYEQTRVSFDDVCAAAGVRPSDLMASIVSVAMEHGSAVADLVAASTHPRIVSQTAKSAMRIGGQFAEIAQKDRMALLQHHKFIPIPRNASLNVNVNATSNANARAAAASSSESSVPSFSADMNELLTPKSTVQRQLVEAIDADGTDE